MKHSLAAFGVMIGLMAGPVPVLGAEPVIGTAGKIELKSSDVTRLISGMSADAVGKLRANPTTLIQAVRAELVRRTLIAEAVSNHFDGDPSIAADLAKVKEEIVLRQWIAHKSALPAGYPTEQEVQAAYDAAKAKISVTSDYQIAQVFVALPDGLPPSDTSAALRKWREIDERARQGASISELAKQYSDHKESAASGGDLGFQNELSLLPEIRAGIQKLGENDPAVWVKTRQGLHLIKVIARKPATVPKLDLVRAEIVADLKRRMSEELERRYVAEVTQSAAPAVNEVELQRLLNAKNGAVAP